MTKKLHPVHPGEILTEDFLNPMHLTPYTVAAMADVPRGRAGTAEDTAKARKAHTAKARGRAASLAPIITRLDPRRLAVAPRACGEADRRRVANPSRSRCMDRGNGGAGEGEAGRVGLPSAAGRLGPPFLLRAL
jgi:hypothetical protein